ncbi:wax ester/triacylglycerol synthase family O-acyltransferase [Pseudonocardia sp. RS010]|uniref:wax ester/triacylglycerol synthase family O-acyltransferase n=1 Tax=Pseudonocardia sp. RS010 TaxID=3385979 RepID=UPI0039A1012F
MTPLDAAFLQAEDAEPAASLAIASIAVFEGPPPGYAAFRAHLAGRLPLVPRYRQRAVRVPFDLGPPVWIDDPHFDIDHHLVRTALPSPGGDAELRGLMARVMATRLDRDRPLWRYWLVENLAGRRWALISTVHHCMVDGVSGTDLYRVLLDEEPEPLPPVPDDWRPGEPPSAAALAATAVRDLGLLPVTSLRAAAGMLRHPAGWPPRLAAAARGSLALAGSLLPAARSSLTGPVARPRRFTWTRLRLADVRAVRHALGGTVNDVLLAAVTGGLRELMLARGEVPLPTSVRSLVPVSVRAPGQEGIRDNRVSLLLARLPVHLADPLGRFAAVRAELTELKSVGEAEAGAVLTGLARFGPFPLVAAVVRLAAHLPQRSVVTVTTNVPGPRRTLYGLGRELVEIIPYVPIASTVRIGVSILSYRDAVVVGLTGDESADDLDVLAAGTDAELARLVALAAAVAGRDGDRGPAPRVRAVPVPGDLRP